MPDYLLEPIETDPDELLDLAIAEITDRFPDWQPSEAQLDWIMMRIFSLNQGLVADSATMVMRSIYRLFGATIVNIQPLDGAQAQVNSTWVAQDDAGYTLEDGTSCGIRNKDSNDLILFSVLGDWVIPPGSTQVTDVLLVADDEGVSGNNLTGLVEQQEPVDWVTNAFTTTISGSGIDPESDEDYLNRLTNNLGLMSPRPVLAEDFALLARNVPGVWRSVAIDNYQAGTNEIIAYTVDATGGSFIMKLPLGSAQSTPIPWNATADQFAAALIPLAADGFPSTDYRATGGPFPTQSISLEFIGSRGEQDIDLNVLTLQSNSLTGGAHDVTWATTQAGAPGDDTTANAVSVSAIDVDGNQLSDAKITELMDYLQSMRAQNFIVDFVQPGYSDVDVQATVRKRTQYDANDVQTRVIQGLQQFLAPSSWGTTEWPPDKRGWGQATVLRWQELVTVVNNIEGVDYVDPLNFAVNGGTMDATDKDLSGTFPLTRPGAMDITVT